MRRLTTAACTLLALLLLPLSAQAQSRPTIDSAALAAVSANARQFSKPAEFVLKHKADLALTAAQVASLQSIAAALMDSTSARQAGLAAKSTSQKPSATMAALGSWDVDAKVDERAVRDALCKQSANTADIMIGMMNDRRTVARVLTKSQVAQLNQLQLNDMMAAIKSR